MTIKRIKELSEEMGHCIVNNSLTPKQATLYLMACLLEELHPDSLSRDRAEKAFARSLKREK